MPSKRNGLMRTRDKAIERRQWLKGLGLAGVTGLAGCSSQDEPTDTAEPTDTDVGFGTDTPEPTPTPEQLPEVGGTYKNSISSDISTLNALYNSEATAGARIAYTSDGAYGFKPGQILFPRFLNLSSDDGQVWTAKLRENLQWSDPYGQMTAEDWVYNITKLHQTDWSGTPASSDWKRAGDWIPVEKTGKYSFRIELPDVDPVFHKKPVMWGHQVAPKDLIKPFVDEQDAKGLEKNEELLNLSYTGNLGAYKLETWDRAKRLVFTRNDDYYMRDLAESDDRVPKAFKKAPYFDRVVTEIIKESSSRLSALKTGDIDTSSIPPNKAATFEKRDDVYLNVTPQPYNVPVKYNMRANGWTPFRNLKVRQGLGCAVDKERLVEGVYRGYADPEYTWQPQWSPWYDDSSVVKYGTGDLYGKEPTMSRLEEGFSDTEYEYDGETLVDGDGDQVELSLYHSAGQVSERQTAEFVAQEFSQNAGIKVDVQGIPGAKFDSDYARQQVPEDKSKYEWYSGPYNAGPRDKVTSKEPWDMSLVYGLNTYPMTPTANSVFINESAAFNYYGYKPNYDFASLFEQASKEPDKEKRKEILGDIFGKISKDQPMGMLVLNSDIGGYRMGINGPVEEFFSGWDFETWHRSDE